MSYNENFGKLLINLIIINEMIDKNIGQTCEMFVSL